MMLVSGASVSLALAWAFGCSEISTEPPLAPPRPTTIVIAPDSAQLPAFDAVIQLMAEVRDQYGEVMTDATVVWSSSSIEVATIDASGLVTAVANGSVTIAAAAGGAAGTAVITVMQVVTMIEVSPAANLLLEGDTLRLVASATDANGYGVAGTEFSWASNDSSVASVDESGLVTAVSAGKADITARSGALSGQAEFVITAPEPTSLMVTPAQAELEVGHTVRVSAEVRDQRGRVMGGQLVAWSSRDSLVATVDSGGLVTGMKAGMTTITAGAGAATATSQITVVESPFRHPTCTATSHAGDSKGRFRNDKMAWRILNPAPWIQRRTHQDRIDPRYVHPVELLRISAAGTARVQVCATVPVFLEWNQPGRNKHGLDFTLLDTLGTVKQESRVYSMVFDVGHYGPKDHLKRAMKGEKGASSQIVNHVYRGGLLKIRENGGLYDVLETIEIAMFQEPHSVEFSGWSGQRDNLDLWASISIYDALGVLWTGQAHVAAEPYGSQGTVVIRARDEDWRDFRDTYHSFEPGGPLGVSIRGKRYNVKQTWSFAHWESEFDFQNPARYLTWDNIPVLWRDHSERLDPDNTENKSAWLCLHHPQQSPGIVTPPTVDSWEESEELDLDKVFWTECYDAPDQVLTVQRCWDGLGDTSPELEEKCRLAGRATFMKFDIPEPPIYR